MFLLFMLGACVVIVIWQMSDLVMYYTEVQAPTYGTTAHHINAKFT